MKSNKIVLAAFIAIATVSCSHPKSEKTAIEMNEIKASLKGNRAPSETMTGVVWLLPFATDSVAQWSSAKVTFEAGAHSNWHTHPDKQVIVAVEGIGYLKEKDKPVQVLHKGDVVDIPAGTLHWHGATPNTAFSQIVINPNIEKGVVNWLESVSDEEYKNVK